MSSSSETKEADGLLTKQSPNEVSPSRSTGSAAGPGEGVRVEPKTPLIPRFEHSANAFRELLDRAYDEYLEQQTALSVNEAKHKKNMDEHKFWATQPVPRYDEEDPDEAGEIVPMKNRDQLKEEPYPLPAEFEWSVMDLDDSSQVEDVYTLLSENYVEDKDASLRLKYTPEFLSWALKPPGYHLFKEWNVGVRQRTTQDLIAFISGIPLKLRVRTKTFGCCEINFICVHKDLRARRLAPLLIKEVTRRVHLRGVFQAIYTAGVVIPTPISTSQYYHRALNISKLLDLQFIHQPRDKTVARMIKEHDLSNSPHLPGLREMEEKDIPGIAQLITRYLDRYGIAPLWTQEEVSHHFLGGRGTGEFDPITGRREGQVVWTYVVEDPEFHTITDFFSFYSLPSTIIDSAKDSVVETAYLYYYATIAAFEQSGISDDATSRRLQTLMGDALIVAHKAHFDVFNALDIMDNPLFLSDTKVDIPVP